MHTVLILNGPNLNLLGFTEGDLLKKASEMKLKLIFFQSNSESTLLEYLQKIINIDLIIFNPAGLTGTSIALRDLLIILKIPFFEVHLSNIFRREKFHQISYFADIAEGILIGLKEKVYKIALDAARYYLDG